MTRYHLDVFRPETVNTARHACTFSVDREMINDLGVFQDGMPNDLNRRSHVRSVMNDERKQRLLEEVATHCDAPIKSFDYLCLRNGARSEQGGRHEHGEHDPRWYDEHVEMANQCVVFEREGNDWMVVGQLAEYARRGAIVKLYDIINQLPVKVRTITIGGTKVTLDTGIASWIKKLNEGGYATLYSDSGLASDHYGRRVNSYIVFDIPETLREHKKKKFVSCMMDVVTKSGNDGTVNMKDGTVAVHFARNVWWKSRDDVSDRARDRRIKDAWASFDHVLEAKQCNVFKSKT